MTWFRNKQLQKDGNDTDSNLVDHWSGAREKLEVIAIKEYLIIGVLGGWSHCPVCQHSMPIQGKGGSQCISYMTQATDKTKCRSR